MPDYSKGKIYTIRCKDDPSLIYVGSTTQHLSQRWTDHKKNCGLIRFKDSLLYKTMNEKKLENFYIELYEDFACLRKEQLEKKEGEITRLIATLNTRVARRTKKEYYEENIDFCRKRSVESSHKRKTEKNERQKEYYIENLELIKQKQHDKGSQIITCECGSTFTGFNIYHHRKTKKHQDLMDKLFQQSN